MELNNKTGKRTFIIAISWIILNFFLIIFMRNNIKPLFFFHLIIIFILFIRALIYNFYCKKERSKNPEISNLWAKLGYLSSKFSKSSGHLFYCYLGFFYIFCTFYFCYMLYMGIIKPPGRFYIIVIVFAGFILAIKETFSQFSQCLFSAFNSFSIPFCDNEYHKYWNCIQNENVRVFNS